MTDLFQSFFYALVVGLVAFCLIVLIDRNVDKVAYNPTRDSKIQKEADRVANNVDKMVEKSKRVYTELKKKPSEMSTPAEHVVLTPPPVVKDPPREVTIVDRPNTSTDPPEIGEAEVPVRNGEYASNYPFFIQVGVLGKSENLEPFTPLADLGELQAHKGADNALRIMLTSYPSRTEAELVLRNVRNRGFSDAFITANPNADNNMVGNAQTAPRATASRPTTPITPPTTVAPPTYTNGAYVIQLSAMRQPKYDTFVALTRYGAIYSDYDPNRGLTKIQLGPFYSEYQANQAKTRIEQSGYGKVFIKRVSASDMNHKQKVLEKAEA